MCYLVITPTRCALLLALVMALSAMYKHPWFITMWSKSTFALDFVVGYVHRGQSATLGSFLARRLRLLRARLMAPCSSALPG